MCSLLLPIDILAFGHEPCVILSSERTDAPSSHDGLALLLRESVICPENIFELEDALKNKQWEFPSYMVANRGRLNPLEGSFNFFEVIEGLLPNGSKGEIFLGHFTTIEDKTILLDQTPETGKLMIEAMAFDEKNGLYNFYELIAQGAKAQWFYRAIQRMLFLTTNISIEHHREEHRNLAIA